MVNSVSFPRGQKQEVPAMRDALLGLLDSGLISLTYWLLPLKKTFPLAPDDARSLLKDLPSLVYWSPEECFWQIVPRAPLYLIEVTDAGYQVACQILEEEGYPNEPLDGYY
jgi:hypothetical protein